MHNDNELFSLWRGRILLRSSRRLMLAGVSDGTHAAWLAFGDWNFE